MSQHSRRPAAAITLHHLTFQWPEADAPLIDDQSVQIPAGTVGLIGPNGAGKTTLIELLRGRVTPHSGAVEAGGEVWVMPQDLPSRSDTVAQVLGISAARDAMLRLLAGEGTSEDVEAVGDDWAVEENATAALAEVGLGTPGILDRRMTSLSGGQAMRVGLAAARLSGAAWTVLDEPSNNLDAAGREVLVELISGWPRGLLVVSHDRGLLAAVDHILELRRGTLRIFGGNFEAYQEALRIEQEAARAALAKAEGDLALEKKQRIASQTTIARRIRAGNKAYAEKREPKIIMGNRKRAAQVSAGKLRGEMQEKEDAARAAVDSAAARIRDETAIRLDLGETTVPSRRRVLRVGEHELVGPERVRLVGANGTGKSTLLGAIVTGDTGDLEARVPRRDGRRWEVEAAVPVGILRQDPRLDPELSALEAVRGSARVPEHRARALLAGLELRGADSGRLCRDLSGGERLRVALAAVLVAEPAPQLLLLDEPSNNLDLDSVAVLTRALAEFRGAVVLVTHDPFVARDAGAEREWDMAALTGDSAGVSG